MNPDITTSGSLFEDVQRFRNGARRECPDQFSVVDRVLALSIEALQDMPADALQPHLRFAWLGFGKSVQSLQAFVLLVEAGAIGEASAMTRIAAECTIVGVALARQELTVAQFLEADDKHWKPLSEIVAACTPSVTTSSAGQRGIRHAKLDAERLQQAYPTSGPNKFSVEALAKKLDLIELYVAGIRFPSGDGAHATKDSFNMHASRRGQTFVRLGPSSVGLKKVLMVANLVGYFMLRFAGADLGVAGLSEKAERVLDSVLETKIHE